MNNKNRKKFKFRKHIIITTLFLLFTICGLSIYFLHNTYAEGETKSTNSTDSCDDKELDNGSLLDKYNFQYKENDGNYELKFEANVSDSELKKKINDNTTFTVIKINDVDYSSKNYQITSKAYTNIGNLQPKEYTRRFTDDENKDQSYKEKAIEIVLAKNSVDCHTEITYTIIPSDPVEDGSLTDEELTKETNIEAKEQTKNENKNNSSSSSSSGSLINQVADYGPEYVDNKLNCSGNYQSRVSLSGFERDICLAKEKAKNNNELVQSNFTCNSDVENNVLDFYKASINVKTSSDEDYYFNYNTKYLYHSEETETSVGKYKYNTISGKSGNSPTDISCKKVCEEGVKVQYGPPVASKAGLCFEYKVKVTSKVSCHSTGEIPKPQIPKVCNPHPTCVTKATHKVWTQGGPNEEYDSCIKKCDGGKYTKKCSSKCYKNVYGDSSTIKTSSLPVSYNTKKLLDEGIDYSYDIKTYGGYYTYRNGAIVWKNSDTSPARFYQQSTSWWCGINLKAHLDSKNLYCGGVAFVINPDGYNDGIPRQIFSKNSFCTDTCTWSQCDGDKYLNYSEQIYDYKHNMELYNEAVDQCAASISCSTKTATFTISVDYSYTDKKGTSNDVTVNFPYDTKDNEDKLNSSCTAEDKNGRTIDISKQCTGKSVDPVYTFGNQYNDKNGCDVKSGNSTILQFAGCYKNCSNNDFYMTEWSFPGSWLNSKMGVSYSEKKTTDLGWRKVDKKFCTPHGANDVNAYWYKSYYSMLYKKGIISKDVIDKFNTTSCDNDTSDKNIKYNIHAKTTNFGYFHWNINVDCFYALYKPSVKDKTTCSNKTNARVRTVDLENLFPENESSTKSSSSSTGTSKTSRLPGFNWSNGANISSTLSKDSSKTFSSFPNKYLNYVQGKGYKIYNSEDNIDYRFNLSPSDLKKIKDYFKQNKNNDYTSGYEKIKSGTGNVTRYTSKLIHEILASNDKNIIPKDYDCNNMYKQTCIKNYDGRGGE